MSEGKKEILLGDCLELMKDIPNGSIDMILCDLPYGTTACKWDTIIPFDKLWEQYERIIKPNGAIVLFGSEPFSSLLRCSNLKLFKYDIIWDKVSKTNSMNAKYQVLKQHEIISIFYKKAGKYYPIKTTGVKWTRGGNKKIDKTSQYYQQAGDVILGKSTHDIDDSKLPTSILTISNADKTKRWHPTQKPVTLFEYLIKTYTNEYELVLDNCAGSGTTAIACLNTNRQFIVMEQEPNYFEKIKKRVGDFNKKFEQQILF